MIVHDKVISRYSDCVIGAKRGGGGAIKEIVIFLDFQSTKQGLSLVDSWP